MPRPADRFLGISGTRWAFWAVVTGVALGMIARLHAFVDNPSMWYDELQFANAFLQVGVEDVLAPLPSPQQAPPLFNLLTLLLIDALGTREMVFRLVPLVASLASVPLFALLARRTLSTRAAVVAVWLFAGTPAAIRYASEFKTYGHDVLIAIVLLLIAIGVQRSDFSRRSLALAAVAGAVAVWASYTAIFILAGAGIALLYGAATSELEDRHARVAGTCTVGVLWVTAFLAFWWIVGRESAGEHFYAYWAERFVPFPVTSADDMAWYYEAVHRLMRDPVGWEYGKKAGAVLLFGGAIFGFRRSRFLGILLAAPLAALVMASAAGQYPFFGRLILFTLPILALAMALGADRVAAGLERRSRSLGAAVLLLVLLQPARSLASTEPPPREREEARTLVAHYLESRQSGDVAWCYRRAEHAFAYYTRAQDAECLLGLSPRRPAPEHIEQLGQLLGRGRVWLLFTHVSGSQDEDVFLPFLDAQGRRLQELHEEGASLYLYRL